MMPIAIAGQVAAPLIVARAPAPPAIVASNGQSLTAFAAVSTLLTRSLPILLAAPFQLVRRQVTSALDGAAATTTVPTVPTGANAADGIISDPLATVDTAGAWTPGVGEQSSLSSAAGAGIPAAILSDTAVQQAISSAALQQGYDPDVLMSSAISGGSSSAAATPVSSSSAEEGSTSSSNAKSSSSSSSESDWISPAGAKSTTSATAGGTYGNDTSTSETDAAASRNGTSFAAPRLISPKIGWVAVLSLGAGYLAVETSF